MDVHLAAKLEDGRGHQRYRTTLGQQVPGQVPLLRLPIITEAPSMALSGRKQSAAALRGLWCWKSSIQMTILVTQRSMDALSLRQDSLLHLHHLEAETMTRHNQMRLGGALRL